jgi:spore coat protein U-like protein
MRSVLVLLSAGLVPATLAPAATKTAKFNVSATVQNDCTVTATNLAFGTVGLTNANVDATSTITVVCTPETPYTVGLNEGTTAGSTVDARLMSSGTSTLAFQLYSDASRSQVWGVTPSVDTVGGTGTGQATNFTVYGRIAPQTPAPRAGDYTTEITATITY